MSFARYSALTPSPRRSSASALSGSANRSAFARYALSAHASRFEQKLLKQKDLWGGGIRAI
ncbi:hypothetical protein gvb03_01525 [Gardnerella vaginalis]|nr:hypothetical protein gvb02_04645 [Gardnerella vaginalis]RDW98740.1 hypothetical protein gvb03_01525 [Gardnerella vaginalis]